MKFIRLFCLTFFLLCSIAVSQEKDFPVLEGPYLGQQPPGKTPEIFAPGIISTEKNEGYIVFLDHRQVIVFDRWLPQIEESNPYYVTEMRNGIWSKPRPAKHTQNPYNPNLPILPDTSTLFFALNRSTEGMSESKTGWDIWMTKWMDHGFSHIRRLEEPVSSEKRDAWASLAKSGSLYFMSNRDGGYGRWDIYKALYKNGKYTDVQNIGYTVNSGESEADPAIAPDESYLIFCSSRPGGFGESDLYITFRKRNGSWTFPQNMGPTVNSAADEEKPYVTPDGKYLFFSNDASGNLDIYWVDARIIEDLKPDELKKKEIPFRTDRLSERVLFIKCGESAIMSNATAIATSQGLVVIDSQYKPECGQRIRSIIEKVFKRDDFSYLLYTHAGVDHIGGASVFPEAFVVGHDNCITRIIELRDRLKSVDIREILKPRLELLRTRLNAGPADEAERFKLEEAYSYWGELGELLASGFEYRLPNLTFDEKLVLHLGDITIKLCYGTPGYSESDILIYIPEEKLLVVGDIFNRDRIPLLHEKSDVKKWLDLFEPYIKGKEGVRYIIGGHDEMISLEELKSQYTYLKDLWEGVLAAKKEGSTLKMVKENFAFNKRYPHLSHLEIHWVSTPDNLHERNIEYIWRIAEQQMEDMGIEKFPVLKGPYLGQKPPGKTAEIFAPGIISTGHSERIAAFTPDGREFYFAVWGAPHGVILCMKEINGRWSKPEVAPFSGHYQGDFTMSSDGKTIVFSSNSPFEGYGEPQENYYSWIVKRKETGWEKPKPFGPSINSPESFAGCPTIADNGNLYFFSDRNGGCGNDDIWISECVNDQYSEPVNLGASINTIDFDLDPFIAPDESYIVFARIDKERRRGADLYISFRKDNGSWTKAKNMGESINSPGSEYCPTVSPDGKYFFFTSTRRSYEAYSKTPLTYKQKLKILNDPGNGRSDIYWVDARVIGDLKPKDLN